MTSLSQLLATTSRTFALTIPYLPEPTCQQVKVAYLLFRIADTFEDAVGWPRERQLEALEEFSRMLEGPDGGGAAEIAERWIREAPIDHEGYQTLLRETPFLLDRFFRLGEAIDPIRHHTRRTIEGMSGFVRRTDDDGLLRLRDLPDLRDYCYTVAGIVGEMLTDLFFLRHPELLEQESYLRERAPLFGEGLQLVNILKDWDFDLREGRSYVPSRVRRDDVFALARHDLTAAAEYTLALQSGPAERGIVAFNALPIEMAWATLDKVEAHGSGSKISRLKVASIVSRVERALDRGEPVIRRAPVRPSV